MDIPIALLAVAGPVFAGVPVGQVLIAAPVLAIRLTLSALLTAAIEIRSLLDRSRLPRTGLSSTETARRSLARGTATDHALAGVPVGRVLVAAPALAIRLPPSALLPAAFEVRSLLDLLRLRRAEPPSLRAAR